MLQLSSVSYGYTEDEPVLEDIHFSLSAGDIYGLLGPNGVGKTTTINAITGQLSVDSGQITFTLDDGTVIDPVNESLKAREHMGVLPEDAAPPSHLTPIEYLTEVVPAFHDTEMNVTTRDVHSLVDQMTQDGEQTISDFEDVCAGNLSRGQQQQVMLIQAFLNEPSLVVIDEPLANLDPSVQQEVRSFIRQYVSNGGQRAVLLSTHDTSTAARICTQVGIMTDGQIREEVDGGAITDESDLENRFNEVIAR